MQKFKWRKRRDKEKNTEQNTENSYRGIGLKYHPRHETGYTTIACYG